jgi:hypothetical protein
VTYSKQMQQIVMDYRSAGEHWPPTKREIAAWAIKKGRWEMPPSAVLDRCANDIGDVMGEIYFTDKKGRRVRLLHPATVKRQGELFTEWDDIRTAPRQHMQIAFQQKRKAIVGECRQLKTDMDSYNDAHSNVESIQISFDFNMDLAELEAAAMAA